jgi:DNA-binding XRE family transcriptional regulator
MLRVKKTSILQKLEARGLTVVRFAQKVGVTAKTMYNIINGASTPNVATAQTIAMLLECNISDVFFFVPEKPVQHD